MSASCFTDTNYACYSLAALKRREIQLKVTKLSFACRNFVSRMHWLQLDFCPSVQNLPRLSWPTVDLDGAIALIKALPQCLQLAILNLSGNKMR
jgi:hypothetical protein